MLEVYLFKKINNILMNLKVSFVMGFWGFGAAGKLAILTFVVPKITTRQYP